MKKRIIIILLVLTNITMISKPLHGDIKFHLQLAMQVANARGVAATMEEAPNVKVEYLNVISQKSKADLEKLMLDFFKQNPVKSFEFTHHGEFKDGVRHMTGTYMSTNGTRFEVYFEAIYDEVDAHHFLSSMRIEKIGE